MSEDWTECSLGDIVKQESRRVGLDEAPEVLSSTKHHGLVPSRAFFKGRQIFSDDLSNYRVVAPNWFAYATNHLAEGSIGINNSGADGCVSPMYTVFSAGDDVEPGFLYRVLKSPHLLRQYALHEQASVDRRGSIRFGAFARIPVTMPSLEEQRWIAEILDTIDETIQATGRVIAKLETLSVGLHRALIYQSNAAFGLSDWSDSTVGESMEIHDRLRLPLSVEERRSMQGPFPYFGPTGQLDSINEFRFEGTFALIGEDGDHFLKFEAWPMTAVVSGRFNVNNHAHVLRGTAACRTEWFAACFRHFDVGMALTRQGAGRFKLNQAALRLLSIPLPRVAEQDRILRQLDALQLRIAAEQGELFKLRRTRIGLAADLLSGSVRAAAL